MGLGVVASDWKEMPPFFFKLGEKMGADVYYKVLRYHILPLPKANYREGNYVWTQDGAPATQLRRCRSSAKLTLLISGQHTSGPPPAQT